MVHNTEQISRGRAYIHDLMVKGGIPENFAVVSGVDIEKMFKLYDQVFFGDQIQKKLDEDGSTIKFQVTKGGKAKLGGWCRRERKGKRCHFTLSFPLGVYTRLFNKGEKNLIAGGVTCSNRLHCLQLVFEHELVHLLMNLYGYQDKIPSQKTIYSAHGKLFKCVLHHYFGHTEIKHNLLGTDVRKQLTKDQVFVGMKVKTTIGGVVHEATVVKKNPKRAVIELDDGKTLVGHYNLLSAVEDKSEKEILKEMVKESIYDNEEFTYKDFKKRVGKTPKISKGKAIDLFTKYTNKYALQQEKETLEEIVAKEKRKLDVEVAMEKMMKVLDRGLIMTKKEVENILSKTKKIRVVSSSKEKLCFELHSTTKYKIYQYTAKSMVILGTKEDLYSLKRDIDAFVGGPKLHAFVRYKLPQCSNLDPPGIIFPITYLENVKKLM